MKHSQILLVGINAKYIHSNPAIYSLRAYADAYYPVRPAGCTLSLAEYTINQPTVSILADLYRQSPDIIAFSCYIWNWEVIQELLAELPKLLPDAKLWLGGPEVSFHSDKIMQKYPQLSGIMVGEGEETFLALLKYYWEDAGELTDIAGLVCETGFTGERALTDINRLPFPYSSGKDFSSKETASPFETFDHRILYYESQRGCPFACTYCLSSIDKRVRLRDLETVKRELRVFLDRRVAQVKFIDRTFNCNAEHALAIWQFLKENDNGVTNFHFEIAADLLTQEQLAVMRDMRPALIQLEIGVQSTNEATLRAIRRHTDLNRLRDTVALINSYRNIHQHLDLIAGLPFENYDIFVSSFDTVYAMAPHELQLGFLKVLKGSPMEAQAGEYGIAYSAKPPYEVLYTKWLSFDELLRLKSIEEMVSLYYNSSQFTYTLPVLAAQYASPFRMYEALADYYRQNGYFTHTPARTCRYQILLDFACQTAPVLHRLFAELLTFDLYLRENIKSRPTFAPQESLDRKSRNRLLEQAGAPKTAHIEQFSYPVWDAVAPARTVPLDTPVCILFDYEKRDALTHNAHFVVL